MLNVNASSSFSICQTRSKRVIYLGVVIRGEERKGEEKDVSNVEADKEGTNWYIQHEVTNPYMTSIVAL